MDASIGTILLRDGWKLAIPVFFICAALLFVFIRNTVRLTRAARIMSVRLIETQEVEFAEAGRVILCVEGPRFTSRFAWVDFELIGTGGAIVEGHTTWFHAKTSGVSKVRKEMKSFDVPAPGRYQLRVHGLGAPRPADLEHEIVFTRPHLAAAMGYVVGITFASIGLIGSIVLFFLSILDKGPRA